jgi:hypothetical protein
VPVERHPRSAPLRAAPSTGKKGRRGSESAAFHHDAPRPARAMHQGEQSSWVRTMRKRRPARGRANDDVWHPGSSAVRPFAGHAFADGSRPVARRRRGDLHPTATAFPVTKGARRCSRRGSIRRRVEFLFSVSSARANERSSQGGRHERGSHSRGTGVAQAPFAPHRQRCSTRTQCPASAPAFRFSSQGESRLCRAPARQG